MRIVLPITIQMTQLLPITSRTVMTDPVSEDSMLSGTGTAATNIFRNIAQREASCHQSRREKRSLKIITYLVRSVIMIKLVDI